VAIESGVTVLTGSDVVGSVWREVALLVELGLSPEQALAAASTRAEQYLGCADDGSLVTYPTDPRDDPWTLTNPAAVVIRGVRVR
jgi:imidazolonepropionase-like amidohydrolase